jgi:hypothetical protein
MDNLCEEMDNDIFSDRGYTSILDDIIFLKNFSEQFL